MTFFSKKVFTPFTVLLICILFAGATFLITFLCMRQKYSVQFSDLYDFAVKDSMVAEAGEIYSLVTLTKGSDMVTWDEKGERVLLLSWNDSPDIYIEGKEIVLDGELWTFTDKEISAWYKNSAKDVENWDLRLKQLIGLPPLSNYTHMTAFWVNVADVIRPAYQPDVTKQVEVTDLDGKSLGEYEAWFNGNIIYSYFTSDYPWTRLGYTYDWAEDSDEYGLTEFLILGGTLAEVGFTMTTDEFIRYMADIA